MRILILFAGALLLVAATCGFTVVVPFPEICRHADVAAIVRIESKAGRASWYASVTQSIFGMVKVAGGNLDRFHFDPAKREIKVAIIALPANSPHVGLEVGTSYLVFLRQQAKSSEYLLVASGFRIVDDRVEGLITDAKGNLTPPVSIKDAAERIWQAMDASENKAHVPSGEAAGPLDPYQ